MDAKHRPLRKWGQNFLRNPAAVARIAGALEPEPGELILEIGPGEGALTEALLALPNPVQAIEIDPDLARRLEQQFGNRLDLVLGDATTAELPSVPFRAAGNLPYNVGTPILRRVVSHPNCRRAVFMLQKEVADRIVALPGGEDYGFLTLYIRIFAEARILMTLRPGSFHPAPKVRSAVVVLDPHPLELQSSESFLIDLISAGFRMRRKKLMNNLKGFKGLTREVLQKRFESAGISPDARAEEMSLEQFDRLSAAIEPVAGGRHSARPEPGSPPSD